MKVTLKEIFVSKLWSSTYMYLINLPCGEINCMLRKTADYSRGKCRDIQEQFQAQGRSSFPLPLQWAPASQSHLALLSQSHLALPSQKLEAKALLEEKTPRHGGECRASGS